ELLDRAIDEVARQMTEGAPRGAAFRDRVRARIERGDAPRRSWRAAFVLSPIAAAIAIAVAAFVLRGRTPPAAPRTAAQQIEPAPPLRELSTGAGVEPAPRPPDSTARALSAAATTAGRLPSRREPGLTDAIVELAPSVDSIAVAPLAVEAITP